VEYGPVATKLEVMYAADGRINPALGARGGHSGGTLWPYKRTRTGELVELDLSGHVHVDPGETIVSISPAGGGYGRPIERSPQMVANDVAEGWISNDRAERVYGVVIDAGGAIDLAATSARRAEIAADAPMGSERGPRALGPAARDILAAGGSTWWADPDKQG
jgi:N-methylhydantoinase B